MRNGGERNKEREREVVRVEMRRGGNKKRQKDRSRVRVSSFCEYPVPHAR